MEMSWQDIAGMADPVLRNLWITQRYHEFAVSLRDAGAGEDATWCAFAVWASKTAGATIRGDVLPVMAKGLLVDNEDTRSVVHEFNKEIDRWSARVARDHLAQVVDGVTGDVSAEIAKGNVLVFEELAPLFTAFIHACDDGGRSTEELSNALAPALQTLGPGESTSDLLTAFGAYTEALGGPPDRALQILRANILAVAHEQHRLQSTIEGALNAAISDTLRKVVEDEVVRRIPEAVARRFLDELTDRACRVLDDAWDTVLTETIMQLVTARETFDLRQDVPALPTGMFPPALSDLSGSPVEAAVAAWDKTGGTGAPSGARDWAVLDERMNFIVNLFRSRQRDASLFDPPFTGDQLAELAGGQLPSGPL